MDARHRVVEIGRLRLTNEDRKYAAQLNELMRLRARAHQLLDALAAAQLAQSNAFRLAEENRDYSNYFAIARRRDDSPTAPYNDVRMLEQYLTELMTKYDPSELEQYQRANRMEKGDKVALYGEMGQRYLSRFGINVDVSGGKSVILDSGPDQSPAGGWGGAITNYSQLMMMGPTNFKVIRADPGVPTPN